MHFKSVLNMKLIFAIQRYFHRQPMDFVRIVEVGPRDGLQNEKEFVPTATKIEFIDMLSQTGLQVIETTSFVSPAWVPQMADNHDVFRRITKLPHIAYPVLVPNVIGLQQAIACGATEIAVFASASEEFSRKNTNCSIADGLSRIREIAKYAKCHGIHRIRGYVSCVLGCPYEGHVPPKAVIDVLQVLLHEDIGCYEISLGDTIGIGTKSKLEDLLKAVLEIVSVDILAIHCHDTYGQALVNICTAMEYGIRVVDASVSGLGGCPYAKGATGNVATEDLVYMLHGMGVRTNVDLTKLCQTGRFISEKIGKPSNSKVQAAKYAMANTCV